MNFPFFNEIFLEGIFQPRSPEAIRFTVFLGTAAFVQEDKDMFDDLDDVGLMVWRLSESQEKHRGFERSWSILKQEQLHFDSATKQVLEL